MATMMGFGITGWFDDSRPVLANHSRGLEAGRSYPLWKGSGGFFLREKQIKIRLDFSVTAIAGGGRNLRLGPLVLVGAGQQGRRGHWARRDESSRARGAVCTLCLSAGETFWTDIPQQRATPPPSASSSHHHDHHNSPHPRRKLVYSAGDGDSRCPGTF